MKQKISTVIYTTLVVCVFCAFGTISKAEQQVYTFDPIAMSPVGCRTGTLWLTAR